MIDIIKNFISNPTPVKKPVSINVDLSSNPLLNTMCFEEKLKNIDSVDEAELYELLKNSYQTLFSDLFMKNDLQYFDIFTDKKFLKVVTKIMYEVRNIENTTRIYCNKLVYDYITYEDHDKDNETEYLMIELSKAANKDIIPIIVGLGFSEEVSIKLVLARFSSFKEMVNVKRLNVVIENESPEVMTEQSIIYLYENLFDRITDLLEGIMFTPVDNQSTPDVIEVNNNISFAIMDMIENMPLNLITKALSNYATDYRMIYSDNPLRFSIRCLSMEEYPRIHGCINALMTENIYVP